MRSRRCVPTARQGDAVPQVIRTKACSGDLHHYSPHDRSKFPLLLIMHYAGNGDGVRSRVDMRPIWAGLACALALGGCASWMPDLSGGPVTVQLRAESDPPGAEARASTGQTCRTPCAMAVPAAGDFTVTFSAPGFVAQTVPVKVRGPSDPRSDPNAGYGTNVEPNPVSVALDPAPPPKPVHRRPPPRKRPPPPPRATRIPPPVAGAPPPPPPPPPAASGFPPPPSAPPSAGAYPPLPPASTAPPAR
jgi:hypothetical protein